MSSRPTYSDEFKADAVALASSSGRPLALVAVELGVSLTALKRWIRLDREGETGGARTPDTPVDAAKYKAMEIRLREVERENEFLKKVSAHLSPKSNGRRLLPPCSAGGERWREDRVHVPETRCSTVLVLPLEGCYRYAHNDSAPG
ncbi:transposase, partial [Pseudarthrobacter sp. J1763]|uniref:transposase n=3 Tax=unclassified Pseudarthrobacter TaxID=2647000 RepID=UPI003D2A38B4